MAVWSRPFTYIKGVLWSIPVVITIRDVICCPVFIQGRSMEPLLQGDPEHGRDLALVAKLPVFFYKYERGGIYLMRSPDTPGKISIKRLIALEGDWLTVPGKSGIQQIPKGFCWVEGDNQQESDDSRTKFGPVPVALIEGRLVQIMWPPHRLKSLGSRYPSNRILIANSKAYTRPGSK